MAFTTPHRHNGYVYPQAYCKVVIHRCNAIETNILVQVYANQQCRVENKEPICEVSHTLPSDLENWAGNPIEGAYIKLQALGLYPEATWNI